MFKSDGRVLEGIFMPNAKREEMDTTDDDVDAKIFSAAESEGESGDSDREVISYRYNSYVKDTKYPSS